MAEGPARKAATVGDPAVLSLRERLEFTRLSEADIRLLVALRPAILAEAEEVVEGFYRHLARFDPLQPLLGDPATVQRLKGLQRAYIEGLTSGDYGPAYVASQVRMGRTHERIGLQPQWYLGAHGVLLDLLVPVVARRHRAEPETGVRALAALSKRMNLDAQLVLDAYFEARQQRAVEHVEKLAAVGELAASIAHEVRNPLAGMKGALEVLRRSLAEADGRREVMDEVMAQVVRLEVLVRDLLQFARPHPLSRKPVHLHALLDRAVRLAQDGVERGGIRVERHYPPNSGRVMGDPQQLEQVFLNLIHNALQAMEGGGVLTLSTRLQGHAVAASVHDTGRGISPSDLSKIFQPFFTTKHRGSGLGLPIVKKIVEAHGGTIDVESTPGLGTTATVVLPGIEVP